MLIGSGGDGVSGTTGGGSGAVTVWYGAAQHIPDSLVVTLAGPTGGNTVVGYRDVSNVTTLLQANDAVTSTAGTATTANQFAASGFYKSTAGQDGATGGVNPSATTFLSGGGAGTGVSVVANYDYRLTTASTSLNGIFLMQPIIVGIGGKGGAGRGGIGCGGGANGFGGPGMVLIASW